MAVILYNYLLDDVDQKIVQWLTMANGDTGQPYVFAGWYPDKSAQLTGTLGAAGQCNIEGSNLTTPTWATLKDFDGLVLNLTALGVRGVRENTYQVRPNVSAGDANTALTLTLLIRK